MVLKPQPAPPLTSLNPDDVLIVFHRADQDGHLRPRAMRATWATVLAAAQAGLIDRIAALETSTSSAQTKLDAETQARIQAFQALSQAISAEVNARGQGDAAEAQTRADAISALTSRVKALEDKPALRIARLTATTNAQGIASVTFSPAFQNVPDVDVIEAWVGDQMVTGAVVSATKSGCSVQVMVSRGTLLLTAGPFAKAGAGTAITVRAIGI